MNHISASILFCDDDPQIISGLRRQFRNYAKTWTMRFATSGQEALRLIHEAKPDVVIADMRMPGMDGGQLLSRVRELYPDTIRLVLSGQTDQGELLNSVGVIHQFLQKPVDPDVIVNAIRRSMELAAGIKQSGLQSVISGLESLPILSATYRKLSEVISDNGSTISEAARVVSRDVGLSTKLLQLVNSSFFGMPRRVTDVKDAVSLVGLDRIRSLALTTSLMNCVTSNGPMEQHVKQLWYFSEKIGCRAAEFAKRHGQSKPVQEQARLAGLLSLIGRAVLIQADVERYMSTLETASSKNITLTTAETIVYGVPQHAVGSYCLGIWAFNNEIVDGVARQATPDLSQAEINLNLAWYVYRARRDQYTNELIDQIDEISVVNQSHESLVNSQRFTTGVHYE